jgi:hypothetical protein
MTFADLRNAHEGSDVFVLGSGATLNHIDPRFFDEKVTVSTNLVGLLLGVRGERAYTHSHYHENALEVALALPESTVVAPLGDRGFAGSPATSLPNLLYYPHVATGPEFDVQRSWVDDGLVVGSSGIHGSMHLAAHLGAVNIIMVGADCGLLDNATNHAKYVDEYGRTQSGDLINSDLAHNFSRWDDHLRMMKKKLIDVYGVRIYSLNPFVNLRLEGHLFSFG